MTSTAPGYNPDQLRYWRAFQTPFVFQSSKQAMELLVKVIEEFPIYKQEFEKIGTQWLFQQPLGEYYMTGKSEECLSVDKLRGKKMRSFGADIPKAFSAIGAVPVTVAPPGIYEALQHGTATTRSSTRATSSSTSCTRSLKFNCGPMMAITGHNISISKRTWNRLPADVQKIFPRPVARDHGGIPGVGRDFEQKAVANLKAQGGLYPFPAAELQEVAVHDPDFLGEWEAATAAATGDPETPKKVVARWRQLLAQ